MVTRYKYHRMTAASFSDALDSLGLSAGQFSRLCGARHERVIKWLDGLEDIPPHIPVMLALLKLPGATALAKKTADDSIIPETYL
ncbi:MAG: hypothetical protein U5K75_02970 [Ahrensia sp.]|nr:hypothetical protein [Ahrensia sp.]